MLARLGLVAVAIGATPAADPAVAPHMMRGCTANVGVDLAILLRQFAPAG